MTAEATISREPVPAIGLSKGSEPDVPDEPAGLIDVVAQAEEALPRWTATMAEITQLIERIGDISQGAGAEITKRDAQGKGFAGRLVVLRQLARDLAEPSDKLVERSSEFTSHLYEVDQGFKALIEHDRRRRVRMSR